MARSLKVQVIALVRELRPRASTSTVGEDSMLASDLGFDSFSLMALAVRLHEDFGVDLAELALRAAEIQTVGDLIATMDSLSHARR